MAVLAVSKGVDVKVVSDAIQHNPAGNAAEQTPIVLLRTQAGA